MKETIEIKKSNVVKAFAEGGPLEKRLLLNLFPGESISGKITDRVKTFDDILAEAGSSELNEIEFVKRLRFIGFTDDEVAYRKIKLICEILNEGWEPNWNDPNEYKYFPWFQIKASNDKPSGFGFSASAYGRWRTLTAVGSRLCFKSSELALFAAKQFDSIYQDYILFKKP